MMKKYLLISLLCISGLIMAMADPTPMAGPAQEEYINILKVALSATTVKIYKTAMQDDKVIVAAVSDPATTKAQIVIARFNSDGSLDTSFNQKGFVTVAGGLVVIIESLLVPSKNEIKIWGYHITDERQRPFTYTFSVNDDGSLNWYAGKVPKPAH